MRGTYADQASALPSGCMPYAYAGPQQGILPVQRFSISEVQSNAGNPMYLPFQRQSYTSQHPCESRLRQSARLGASTNQTLPVNTTCVEVSSAAHHHTAATTAPLSYPPHSSSGHRTAQGTCGTHCWCLSGAYCIKFMQSLQSILLLAFAARIVTCEMPFRSWVWQPSGITHICMHTSTFSQQTSAS